MNTGPLHAKEAGELRARRTVGELADLLEVVPALAADAGYTLDEVISAAVAKSAKRGGFTGRLWLAESRAGRTFLWAYTL